jgi:hypothetical protein
MSPTASGAAASVADVSRFLSEVYVFHYVDYSNKPFLNRQNQPGCIDGHLLYNDNHGQNDIQQGA